MKKNLLYKIIYFLLKYVIGLVLSFKLFNIKLSELIRTHYFEKKLNIQTDEDFSFKDELSLHKDGKPYGPISYHALRKIIDYLKLKPEDVFVDFGCGKGRVVFYVALQNIRRVIGVELNQELINIAYRNLANFKFNKAAIKLIHCDAVYFKINDENIFFMFNPFGYETFKAVIENIKNSLVKNPRQIRIVYVLHWHRKLLRQQNWLTLEAELEGSTPTSIWRNKF